MKSLAKGSFPGQSPYARERTYDVVLCTRHEPSIFPHETEMVPADVRYCRRAGAGSPIIAGLSRFTDRTATIRKQPWHR